MVKVLKISTEERTEWSVWVHEPGGVTVHATADDYDEDEERWAVHRAAEIREAGGKAEVRSRTVITRTGPWALYTRDGDE